MNAATIRKSNYVLKVFEHNINKLIRDIDRFNKSKEAEPDTMSKTYKGIDDGGNRSWGPF